MEESVQIPIQLLVELLAILESLEAEPLLQHTMLIMRHRESVLRHASKMPCPLERGRSYLGLSLPRLALPCNRCRAERAGGGTSRASRPCGASGMTGLTWQPRIGCRDHVSKAVSQNL